MQEAIAANASQHEVAEKKEKAKAKKAEVAKKKGAGGASTGVGSGCWGLRLEVQG